MRLCSEYCFLHPNNSKCDICKAEVPPVSPPTTEMPGHYPLCGVYCKEINPNDPLCGHCAVEEPPSPAVPDVPIVPVPSVPSVPRTDSVPTVPPNPSEPSTGPTEIATVPPTSPTAISDRCCYGDACIPLPASGICPAICQQPCRLADDAGTVVVGAVPCYNPGCPNRCADAIARNDKDRLEFIVWLKNKMQQIQVDYMRAIEACIKRTELAYADKLANIERQLQLEHERSALNAQQLAGSDCGTTAPSTAVGGLPAKCD